MDALFRGPIRYTAYLFGYFPVAESSRCKVNHQDKSGRTQLPVKQMCYLGGEKQCMPHRIRLCEEF
jgi:hypothetical protein